VARSIEKGPYVDRNLMKKVEAMDPEKKMIIKTWARRSTIPPEFVGQTFGVHNGRKFQSVYVTENMVGHKLGEFAATRTFKAHSGRGADKKGDKKTGVKA